MYFSCCIEMLFTEYPFAERIYQAKECGFDYVEFWSWEDKDCSAIQKAISETGMKVALFQGNTEGRMVDSLDRKRYVAGVRRSVEKAKELGAKQLFLMSDIMQEDRSVLACDRFLSDEEKMESTQKVLEELIPISEESGITFLIEPLNTKVDHKGYSLYHSEPAFQLIREIGHPGIRVLYDAYHMQIMEGNVIDAIRRNVNEIGYFHIADVPGRCEPGTGELNYQNILKALREAGYQGIVGFEFTPSGEQSGRIAEQTLKQLKWGIR